MRSVLVLLLALVALTATEASHFRYGHVNWWQTGVRKAQIKVDQAWRRNFSYYVRQCSGGVCNVGDVVHTGTLTTGGTPSSVRIDLKITSVNAELNYMTGTMTTPDITYSSDGPHEIRFYTCCRIGGIKNSPVELPTIASLKFIAGRDQASAVTVTPPIVTMQRSTLNRVAVPVSDPDLDLVRFERFAIGNGAGTINNLKVDPATGVMEWNPETSPLGLYTVVIKMSDYDYRSCSAPVTQCSTAHRLSEVMVDFFVEVIDKPGFCDNPCSNAGNACNLGISGQCNGCGGDGSGCVANSAPVVFVPPTPQDGSTLVGDQGSTVTFPIAAGDNFSFDTVVLQPAWTVTGMELQNVQTNANSTTATFSWPVPADAQAINQACFYAVDNHGADSPLHCITIRVGGINVKSLLPNTGTDAGDELITVVGINFGGGQPGDYLCKFKYTLTGVDTPATLVSSSEITCKTPKNIPTGAIVVEVSKDKGQRFTDNRVQITITKGCPGACSNHGTCNNGVCRCEAGWWSPSCENPCPGGNPVCSGQGVCDDGADGTGKCSCLEGFFGTDCTDTTNTTRIVNDVDPSLNNNNVDLDWSSGTLAGAWSGFQNTEADPIEKYEYAIGSRAEGTDVQDWTDVGLTTSAKATVTASSLNHLTKYYWTVKSKRGKVNSITSSNGIAVDRTKPEVTIIDGAEVDTDWTKETDSHTMKFIATDPETGLKELSWGVSATGSQPQMTPVPGLSTTAITTDKFKTENLIDTSNPEKIYYFHITATNRVGETTAAKSNGFRIDNIAPLSEGVRVLDGVDPSKDATFLGDLNYVAATWSTFTDVGSGVAYHEWAIGTTAGGTQVQAWTKTLDSSTAIRKEENLGGEGTDLLVNGREYFVSVRAVDRVGLVSQLVSSDGFTVDNTPPTLGAISDGPEEGVDEDVFEPHDTGNDVFLTATWKDFNDPESAIDRYEVAWTMYQNATLLAPFQTVGIKQSARFPHKVSNGTTVYCVIRAYNGAGIYTEGMSDGMVISAKHLVADGDDPTQEKERKPDDGNNSSIIIAVAATTGVIGAGIAGFLGTKALRKKRLADRKKAMQADRRKAMERNSTKAADRSAFRLEPLSEQGDIQLNEPDPLDEVEDANFH